MAAPNYFYVYGTTPATGGQAAILQALKSSFLGVNTTVSTAVTVTGSQAVTPGAMTNIAVGTAVWINWGLSDQEAVSVTATTGSTFTGAFTKTHTANYTVTCGLAGTLGVSNPWTLSTYVGTQVSFAVQSSASTAAGDNDFAVLIFGNTTATNISVGTANDIDNSGTNSAPQYGCNYNGTVFSTVAAIQNASFSWWLVISEFHVWLAVNIGGTYGAIQAGTLMTPQPANQKGVGTATATIATGATSVTVTPDISARLVAGQKIYIINQSHNSGSTHWASLPTLVTVTSVSGTGSQATIGITAPGVAYDTGALVGSVPLKYAGASATGAPTGTTNFQMFLDTSESSFNGQAVTFDTSGITSDISTDASPTLAPNALYLGELQLPLFQGAAGKLGIAGYMYGAQLFAFTGVAQEDVFADPTGSASVWKTFLGASQAIGMGPLLNPQNTLTSMSPYTSTPWIP